MPVEKTVTEKTSPGADGLKKTTKREERTVESGKGGSLNKGSERFEEHSESSGGKGRGEKQGSIKKTVTTRETRS